MKIEYDQGTVVIDGWPQSVKIPAFVNYDHRINKYRAMACYYRDLISLIPVVDDHVFQQSRLIFSHPPLELRGYQKQALSMWESNGKRGVVVLPTATGKTHIGIEAISRVSESSLVVAPTIELVQQWRSRLESSLGVEIGQLGGDVREVKDITVSTYDSAYLMAEKLGNRFRFLLADEVHHMASEQYSQIAKMYASPYRLGLSATYERSDGLQELLAPYFGDKIFEMGYEELRDYIAGFEIRKVQIELSDQEEEEYNTYRDIFLSYIRRYNISLKGQFDFQNFIRRSWNREGREALLAWRKSRQIAFNARAKLDFVRYVLSKHRNEKTLIFSEDTDTAYLVSKEFLIPALTYKTPGKERKMYLDYFKQGKVTKLSTSRILDEGVDVPDASVAVIISGSGSGRQFKQRLGRIVRPGSDKHAVMYELVASGTGESGTSKRRSKGVPNRASFNKTK
jgi:superfamily II DNA or RNA helicase